jgi:hypothetical protein
MPYGNSACQQAASQNDLDFRVPEGNLSSAARYPLLSEETTLDQGCHEGGPVDSNLAPVEVEARRSACNHLMGAAPEFHQKYTAVSTGLSHLEEVYKREKNTQERLLETAQKLE